jgi:hypothetical protein
LPSFIFTTACDWVLGVVWRFFLYLLVLFTNFLDLRVSIID